MFGGLPEYSFVFVEFEDGGSVFEVATLALGTVGLDVTKSVHRLLALAGEPRVVQAQSCEGAVGVDDVEVGAVEEGGLERGNSIEAPGCVGEFLGELGLGGSGGLVFVEEAAAMRVERGSVFGGEDGAGGR